MDEQVIGKSTLELCFQTPCSKIAGSSPHCGHGAHGNAYVRPWFVVLISCFTMFYAHGVQNEATLEGMFKELAELSTAIIGLKVRCGCASNCPARIPLLLGDNPTKGALNGSPGLAVSQNGFGGEAAGPSLFQGIWVIALNWGLPELVIWSRLVRRCISPATTRWPSPLFQSPSDSARYERKFMMSIEQPTANMERSLHVLLTPRRKKNALVFKS